MTTPTPNTPYATAGPLLGSKSTVYSESDATRLATYDLYERMYWNIPGTFKISQRGSDAQPIYIPSPRVIVETTNRFLAKDWRVTVPPDVGTNVEELSQLFGDLMKREQMYSKFGSQKRYGLIRGDAIWHVVGNADKPQGSRISIYEVDPAEYFPIFDDDNIDKIVGVHLVTPIEDDPKTKKARVRRQTYRKQPDGRITNEINIYEQGYWDDRPESAVHVDRDEKPELHLLVRVKEETPLPEQITQIPLYHIKNTRQAADPFGSSELRGFERIIAAVNQTMSDAELSLALDGLGVYFTTSGAPTDANGNETNWQLGPGRVVEGETDSSFVRVSGVTSVEPYVGMKTALLEQVFEAGAIPDVARGNVEVTTAESGIALALRMGPILAKNAEKEVEMLGTYQHMTYDITNMWFPAYEGFDPNGGATAEPIVGDPLPQNREKTLEELVTLYKEKLAPYSYIKEQLAVRLGIELPDNAEEEINQATARDNQLVTDPFGDRMNQEAGTGQEVDDGTPPAAGS